MAYQVRITLTRPNESVSFQAQDSSFIAETESLMAANNVTAERTLDGNTVTIVYTAPTEADYDNFYEAMIPRWSSIGTVGYANDNGIVINTTVL